VVCPRRRRSYCLRRTWVAVEPGTVVELSRRILAARASRTTGFSFLERKARPAGLRSPRRLLKRTGAPLGPSASRRTKEGAPPECSREPTGRRKPSKRGSPISYRAIGGDLRLSTVNADRGA
jgi:hypothetical protein